MQQDLKPSDRKVADWMAQLQEVGSLVNSLAGGASTKEAEARRSLKEGAKADRIRLEGAVTGEGKAGRPGPNCSSACDGKAPTP